MIIEYTDSSTLESMSMTPSKLVQHRGTVSLQILSSSLTPKEKEIKIHFHFCLPPVYLGSPNYRSFI